MNIPGQHEVVAFLLINQELPPQITDSHVYRGKGKYGPKAKIQICKNIYLLYIALWCGNVNSENHKPFRSFETYEYRAKVIENNKKPEDNIS